MSEEQYKRIFSKNLKRLMSANGKEQTDLINDLGFNKSAVSTWYNGKRLPRMDKVDILARYFGVKRSDLIEDNHSSLNSELNYAATSTPEEFETLIKPYRTLDPHGKETVNLILEREAKRTKEHDERIEELNERIKERDKRIMELERCPAAIIEFPAPDSTGHLTKYFRSASAGGGVFILGNEETSSILIADQDWDERTDYVISVSGSSMEPDFLDGDKVMVSQRMEMRRGDVGIFIVDGNAYIKEYGMTELISRNHKFPNIKISEYNNVVCMGKVIGKIRGAFQILND